MTTRLALKTIRVLAVTAALCAAPTLANGQQDAPAGTAAEPRGPLDRLGLGLGLGLGFQWNVSGPDLVDRASINGNGLTVVDQRSNTTTGVVGELHAFPYKRGQFGVGPFVAVEVGSEQIIRSIGLGVMVGMKLDTRGRGFGLGIGYAAQPARTVLGDEFVENQPAPKGPTGTPLPMRLKVADNGALMGVLAITF